MSSEEVLLINAILYTLTLIYFYMKYRFSMGLIVWFLYTISAWSSFFFIQQPMYIGTVHDSKQTLLPCFYLYAVFLIAMQPLMKLKKIENVSLHSKRLIKGIMIICTIVQIVFVIVDIPTMIKVITSGSMMLNELRSTVYGADGLSRILQNALLNKISLLYSGIRVIATEFSIISFFTFKDNRKLVDLFAISALLNNIRIIIVQVGRGEMILMFLLYVSTFYLMRDWIDKETKRKIILLASPIIIIGVVFFWAITVSRFGDSVGYFMWKYLGEPMNNFNGILFKRIQGTTNGRAYFSLIYRYLFGEGGVTTADDKWRLIKEATGIRGDIFYTWVGGLIIEFGKGIPILVAIILNRVLSKVVRIKKYYTGDLIMLIFFLNFYIRGIFLFPTQNFEGMLMILYTIILYFIFRIRRNNKGHLVYVLSKRGWIKKERVG